MKLVVSYDRLEVNVFLSLRGQSSVLTVPYSPTGLHLNEFVCRILLKQHQHISDRSLTQKLQRFATIRQEISVKIALKQS